MEIEELTLEFFKPETTDDDMLKLASQIVDLMVDVPESRVEFLKIARKHWGSELRVESCTKEPGIGLVLNYNHVKHDTIFKNGEFIFPISRLLGAVRLIYLKSFKYFPQVVETLILEKPQVKNLVGISEHIINFELYSTAELESLAGLNLVNDIYINAWKIKTLHGLPRKCSNLVIDGCNSLRSLDGSPEEVRESFILKKCVNIESLEGGPELVEGDYICAGLKLRSLKGVPDYIGGIFNCSNNILTELDYMPSKIGAGFNCSHNMLRALDLTNVMIYGGRLDASNNRLEFISGIPDYVSAIDISSNRELQKLNGMPYDIDGDLNCANCGLLSLEGAPKQVDGNFNCSSNFITSTNGIPFYIGGNLCMGGNNIVEINEFPHTVNGWIEMPESSKKTYQLMVSEHLWNKTIFTHYRPMAYVPSTE